MAQVTLHGDAFQTVGELPTAGSSAPDFKLTASNLSDKTLASYAGKKKLLNIFPSVDTPVCATSVKKFSEHAKNHADVAVLMVSADLPFAHARFCTAEGVDNVENLSMLRDKSFARDYGTLIIDGPFAGVSARAVVVLDEDNKVVHSELVSEIADEPDYDAALAALA